jgi:hypothetical protein
MFVIKKVHIKTFNNKTERSNMQSNKASFDKSSSFAEVIESSIYQIDGICWNRENRPRLGQLIKIKHESLTLIGCVTETLTESIDPIKTPIAYQMTEEELREEQPQIFEFLVSKFKARIIGLWQEEEMIFSSPEKPVNNHSFISDIDNNFAGKIINDPEFFHMLLAGDAPCNQGFDELLLSIFRQLSQSGPASQHLMESFYNLYRTLLKNDAYRVRHFFKRLSKIIKVEGV